MRTDWFWVDSLSPGLTGVADTCSCWVWARFLCDSHPFVSLSGWCFLFFCVTPFRFLLLKVTFQAFSFCLLMKTFQFFVPFAGFPFCSFWLLMFCWRFFGFLLNLVLFKPQFLTGELSVSWALNPAYLWSTFSNFMLQTAPTNEEAPWFFLQFLELFIIKQHPLISEVQLILYSHKTVMWYLLPNRSNRIYFG